MRRRSNDHTWRRPAISANEPDQMRPGATETQQEALAEAARQFLAAMQQLTRRVSNPGVDASLRTETRDATQDAIFRFMEDETRRITWELPRKLVQHTYPSGAHVSRYIPRIDPHDVAMASQRDRHKRIIHASASFIRDTDLRRWLTSALISHNTLVYLRKNRYKEIHLEPFITQSGMVTA
jgi:hypothetical protein